LNEEERTQCFEEILRNYENRIYNLVYWRVGNEEDARDLTQDVFLKVYKALPKFEGRSSAYTWVYRIALNHTTNFLRRKRIFRFFGIEKAAEDPRIAEDPRDEMEKAPMRAKVRDKVQKLPDKYKQVVMLYYFEQKSYREMEEILGVSQGTLKSRLNRARAILSRSLRGIV
jgi:RNA polymerase sigma-70 factor (ECF subfamily)